MEVKQFITFLCIVLILCITGCGSGSEVRDIVGEERKGTEGISISFLDDVPDEVIEGTVLPLSVLIQNKGAYDVTDGFVILNIDDSWDIESGDHRESYRIEGSEVGNVDGEEEVVTFYIRALPLFSQTELMRSSLRVLTEYTYETQAAIEVCVDTDVIGRRERQGVAAACSADEITVSGGQGGPIAVTRVVPHMQLQSGDRIVPSFDVYIDNVGDGELLGLGDELDTVDVFAFLGEEELACSKNIVDLSRIEWIRCTLPFDIGADIPNYESLLSVRILYKYRDSVQEEVVIKSTNALS